MNFLFPQSQITPYKVQLYNAISKKTAVNEDWPSYENWQNQNQTKGNKSNLESQIALGNQAPSQVGQSPHLSTKTDYSSRKPQPSNKSNKQYSIVHSEQINKNDVYLLLRSPQTILGHTNPNGNGLFIKMVKQSIQYDQINKSNNIKKWNDKSLPKELYFQDCDGKNYQLVWKDIDQIGKQSNRQITIITTPIEKTDVVQGKLGDCYFLAAIAAFANSSRPQRILRLFSSIEINQQGIFKARLMFKGILQEVIVDSTFPFIKNGKGQEGGMSLLGCSPNSLGEIYTMILQKCWAKLWKSYQTIDGGFPHQALHALSGALTKNYVLSIETNSQQTKAQFFNQILNYCKAEYVMCAGTTQTETMNSVDVIVSNQQQKIGLASRHIYCVSSIIERGNQKKVKLYNPWGFNYNTQNVKIQGQFQMTWERFLKEFQYLTVCKIHDNANYLSQSLKFEPNKLKFIELTVRHAKTGYFAITISQTDKKQSASEQGQQYLNITYIVVKIIKSTQIQQYELITIRSESQFSDHYLELHNIKEGDYLIAVYISDSEIKEELTFGVYSQDCFGFKEKQNVISMFQKNFIPNVMLNYHHNTQEQRDIRFPVPHNRNIWIQFNLLNHKKARLGYYILHVSQGQKAYQIQFGKNEFQQIGLSLMYPYNKECFKLVAEPGYESIAIVVIQDLKKYRQRVLSRKDLYKMVKGKPQYKK